MTAQTDRLRRHKIGVALISILILTKNEQKDLPGCLASVAWCDDIHILDSGSTDDTCEIARRCGASVVTRTCSDNTKIFGGDEAAHRNWGLRNIAFKHPWVLLLDADEEATEELASAIGDAVASPGANVAFRIQRRDFLNKKWLKHVQTSPFYMRLVRPEKIHYERVINPLSIADGPVGSVRGFLNHYPFSKGMGHWLDRHNSYSTLEARQIMQNRRSNAQFSVRKAFTAREFHERRYHQKELFYRIPCRPVFKFLLLYVGKRGFLDGRAGLQYALLQSIYEYMIVLKVQELERSGK
jgi:glycosyltransferase involved in cell wall biosynthesis